jgi:dephospho-CoA kinase
VLVALTGGIGSGKSTVASLFADHGAIIVKADDLAKEVLTKGSPEFEKVLAEFGNQILASTGEIDRKLLAKIVFSDQEKLEKLEQITHPAVQAKLANIVKENSKESIIIYEIPLLIEKNLFSKFDKSIAVIADLQLREDRAGNRGIAAIDFQARLTNQTSDDLREKSVDLVIYNNGNLAQLAQEVDQAWLKLTS